MGVETVFSENINGVMKEIDKTAWKRMLEAVNAVRNETLETLSGSRSGRVYRVPGTKKTYQASAPGEAPAQQLGDLRKSVTGGLKKEGRNIIGYVGTGLDYGPMLEYGTSKMAPRPWLRISFEKSMAEVKRIFTRRWL